jgi:hypothetical protein
LLLEAAAELELRLTFLLAEGAPENWWCVYP